MTYAEAKVQRAMLKDQVDQAMAVYDATLERYQKFNAEFMNIFAAEIRKEILQRRS